MDLTQEDIRDAQHRQQARGRLRWLVDDFCRDRHHSPTRGERLDEAAAVLAFVGADHYNLKTAPDEKEIAQLRSDVRGGLTAIFQPPQVWRLVGMPLVVDITRDPGERERYGKMPADVLDHEEGVVRRLWIPLQLYPVLGERLTSVSGLRQLFSYVAALEIVKGWKLLGRCPRCWEFFFRVRRQQFCSLECKQEEMNERKARRRGRGPRRRLSATETKAQGRAAKAAAQHRAGLEHDRAVCPTCTSQRKSAGTGRGTA